MLATGPGVPHVLRSLLLPAALLLGACASLSESECRSQDWAELGRADGQHGRPLSQFKEHREACKAHGVKPDGAAYKKGREEGLRTYCTPSGGYVAGRRGDSYEDVCNAAAEREFRPAFRDGRQVHAILRDLEELQRRMDDVEMSALSTGDLSPEARTYRNLEMSELRRQYQQRQWEAERLDGRYALKYKVDPLRDLDYDR